MRTSVFPKVIVESPQPLDFFKKKWGVGYELFVGFVA
jgi:hypothetical protein